MILIICVKILIAYILIDFLTGIYHLLTDAGINIKSQVEMFQEHHITNHMDGPGFIQTIPVAILVFLVGLYFGSSFLIIMSIFTAIVQVPHYYAHVPSYNIPLYIKYLQKYHLIISKHEHQQHHNGVFDDTYCIVSGWNNIWMNPIIHLFKR